MPAGNVESFAATDGCPHGLHLLNDTLITSALNKVEHCICEKAPKARCGENSGKGNSVQRTCGEKIGARPRCEEQVREEACRKLLQ